MSVEHRRHQRYSVALAAEVTLGFETIEARAENISAGGVALVMSAAVDQGAELQLTLILTQDGIEDPFEEPFEGRAKVAWVRPNPEGGHLIGVQFGGVAADQQARLERFIARLQP